MDALTVLVIVSITQAFIIIVLAVMVGLFVVSGMRKLSYYHNVETQNLRIDANEKRLAVVEDFIESLRPYSSKLSTTESVPNKDTIADACSNPEKIDNSNLPTST